MAKSDCGCKVSRDKHRETIVMCAQHEAEWAARHTESAKVAWRDDRAPEADTSWDLAGNIEKSLRMKP